MLQCIQTYNSSLEIAIFMVIHNFKLCESHYDISNMFQYDVNKIKQIYFVFCFIFYHISIHARVN